MKTSRSCSSASLPSAASRLSSKPKPKKLKKPTTASASPSPAKNPPPSTPTFSSSPLASPAMLKNRVKVDHQYKTNLENVWAIGDCISMHWPEQMAMGGYRHPDLAHVAHHEAVMVVERLAGHEREDIDYKNIPGCTYTHPQVASMGATEKKLREEKREIRIGKFPFSVSGRAMAAGETDGFVKLIFDAKFGELLGVHMIGENVTELLSELVLARKLEATEEEIIDAIHPHPTLSEAIMEAAGVSMN